MIYKQDIKIQKQKRKKCVSTNINLSYYINLSYCPFRYV